MTEDERCDELVLRYLKAFNIIENQEDSLLKIDSLLRLVDRFELIHKNFNLTKEEAEGLNSIIKEKHLIIFETKLRLQDYWTKTS